MVAISGPSSNEIACDSTQYAIPSRSSKVRTWSIQSTGTRYTDGSPARGDADRSARLGIDHGLNLAFSVLSTRPNCRLLAIDWPNVLELCPRGMSRLTSCWRTASGRLPGWS